MTEREVINHYLMELNCAREELCYVKSLLRDVYEHGENFELHEKIRLALKIDETDCP